MFNELDKIVAIEKDKKLLDKAMVNYPVTLDIILDMIEAGVEPYKIYEICKRWYIDGINIKVGWKCLKAALPIIR